MLYYKNMKLIKNNYGFTLIELLMVISIITLISSMFFSYVGSASAKSRDSVRLSDMQQINTAANMYYQDKKDVPDSIETLVATGYLSAVLKDPKTGVVYGSKAMTTSSGKRFFIATTTYETIKREDGENQDVGVIVSGDDFTLADICLLLQLTNSFPNCIDNVPTDQIIGMTRRGGSGGGGTVEPPVESVSDCSLTDINLSCPNDVSNGCYCNGGKYANGLVWQYPNPNLSMNWYDAKSNCENIGWRLPSIDELEGAMLDQFNNGGDNPGGFNYVGYWSKDSYDASSAWVCMNDGAVGRTVVDFNNLYMYMRCVASF